MPKYGARYGDDDSEPKKATELRDITEEIPAGKWNDWSKLEGYKGDKPPSREEMEKKHPDMDDFGHLPGSGKHPGTIWMKKHRDEALTS